MLYFVAAFLLGALFYIVKSDNKTKNFIEYGINDFPPRPFIQFDKAKAGEDLMVMWKCVPDPRAKHFVTDPSFYFKSFVEDHHFKPMSCTEFLHQYSKNHNQQKERKMLLRGIEKGSKVEFAIGGTGVVETIEFIPHNDWKTHDRYFIAFKNYPSTIWSYYPNGRLECNADEHPMGIKKVMPPEFDWSTVKTGMAFKAYDDKTVFYVGKDSKGNHIFDVRNTSESYPYRGFTDFKTLIRDSLRDIPQ